MKILVTGAGGFIGSHLTEKLVHRGHDVRALIKYNSVDRRGWLDVLSPDVMNGVEVISGDICDRFFMMRAAEGVDAVLHLAAMVGIPYSYFSPSAYVHTNVVGTCSALTAARIAGVSRFIHTSTSEVYGTAQGVPMGEEHRLHPQSPYAASKVGADQIAMSFHHSYDDMSVAIIRPFNAYGPRQSARAVIPSIITQLLEGNRVKLGATSPTRDFTFVDDLARAFVAALTADIDGEVINVGSGTEISIKYLASAIAGMMDIDGLEIVHDPQRDRPTKSEVDRLHADVERARHLLGWTPAFDLENGLYQAIEWYRQNQDRYRAGEYVV